MNLSVQPREKLGSSAARELRAKGLMPGEVYGHGFENVHIAVPAKEFTRIFKEAGETTVITLEVGADTIPTLIYEVAHDPLSGAVAHADFYRVRMDEKITAGVPVEFIGQSPAVKGGGVLIKAVQEVAVEALPGDMPRSFAADISRLTEIGQSLYVKDLPLADSVKKGVLVKLAPDTVVATVIAPRAEEVAPAAPVDISAVKVETEEKKAMRQAQAGIEGEKEKSGGEKAASVK